MSHHPPPRTDPARESVALAWTARELVFNYPSVHRRVIDRISIDVPDGACTAVIGPNGSGKSTLLRLLLGHLTPRQGTISFRGRAMGDWSRRELARTIGVVAQHEQIAFPISVRDLVAMGRYPHLGLLRPEGRADRDAVHDALRRCDSLDLADREFDTLSGGERQRVRIARALAQQPRVLALDEPTIALDVRHEMEIFELIRDLVHDGVSVMIVTHNLNLAARYADHLVLLHDGRLAAAGSPTEVLEQRRLERVYEWPLRLTTYSEPGRDAGTVQITPVGLGPGDRAGNTGGATGTARNPHQIESLRRQDGE